MSFSEPLLLFRTIPLFSTLETHFTAVCMSTSFIKNINVYWLTLKRTLCVACGASDGVALAGDAAPPVVCDVPDPPVSDDTPCSLRRQENTDGETVLWPSTISGTLRPSTWVGMSLETAGAAGDATPKSANYQELLFIALIAWKKQQINEERM